MEYRRVYEAYFVTILPTLNLTTTNHFLILAKKILSLFGNVCHLTRGVSLLSKVLVDRLAFTSYCLNNTVLPLLRAFMDDLSLTSSTVSGAQTLLLSRCITALNWAGLEFRADKSRSIVIVKGRFSRSKASDQPEVSSAIPCIHSRPIKFLGRIIHGSISEGNSSAELTDKLLAGLSVTDKSHFPRTQKLWILQHLLIPRIQ